jgi:Tol biopolymer transport system component
VILGPPGDQVHPDWSPDGSQIAYVQRDGTGAQQILITDLQGTKPQPLLKDYPAKLSSLFWDNPAWSPDGSQISTVGYEGDPQTGLPERLVLAIVTVASGQITVLGELESSAGFLHSFPRWSPTGDAFVISLDHFKGDESSVGGSRSFDEPMPAGRSPSRSPRSSAHLARTGTQPMT